MNVRLTVLLPLLYIIGGVDDVLSFSHWILIIDSDSTCTPLGRVTLHVKVYGVLCTLDPVPDIDTTGGSTAVCIWEQVKILVLCMYLITIVVRMRRVDYTVVCIVTSCIMYYLCSNQSVVIILLYVKEIYFQYCRARLIRLARALALQQTLQIGDEDLR